MQRAVRRFDTYGPLAGLWYFAWAMVWIWALVAAAVLFCAYQQAKVYNELTGAHVTTWQSMWVQLQVRHD